MQEEAPRFVQVMELQRDKEAGTVWLDVKSIHMQGNGVVHGSVMHALLDTVMGIESYRAAGDRAVATAEISVRYLLPVFDGRLVATARVLKTGKRLIVVDGEVMRGDERVAIGQATFVPIG